jgi:acetyl esterase/lipase
MSASLFSATCLAAASAAPPAAAAYPGTGAALRGTIQRDVVYGTTAGVGLKLDLFFPRTRTAGPWPLIVVVHGGGWSEGDKYGFDLPQARGKYLVASINYRMFPAFRFPAMIEDVKLAIRYLRANAAGYNLDPERVAILGHSAGAHLAALAALSGPESGWDLGDHLDQSSAVKAAIILSGPSDLARTFSDQWAEGLRFSVFGEDQWEAASPVHWAHAGAPPFFIAHGEADAVVGVEHGRALHEALRAAGSSSRLLVLRGAGHGFEPVGGWRFLQVPRTLLTIVRLTGAVMRFLDRKL